MRRSSRGRHAAAFASLLALLAAAGCGAHADNRAAASSAVETGSGGGAVAGAAVAAPTQSPSPTATPVPVPRTAARAMRTITFKGAPRTYLYVTPKPGIPRPLPLLVVLHGRHADAAFEEGRTGFDKVAAAGQGVVVYPNATGKDKSWNAGRCCDASADSVNNVDDVGFIDAVIKNVRRIAAIDPRRIYVAGYSTGAMMAYRYACARPTTVAALAEVGGVPVKSGCPSPGAPVSVLAIHGTKDHSVPYDGTDRSQVLRVWTPSVASVIDSWRTHDGCAGNAAVSSGGRVETSTWSLCRNGTTVQLVTLIRWDHDWPHRSQIGLEATDTMWNFLRRHHR